VQSLFFKQCLVKKGYETTQRTVGKIRSCFPNQGETAKISDMDELNAVLYLVENGCKRRRLLPKHGDWHVIYVRVNCQAKKGALQAAILQLRQMGFIQIKVNSLNSACTKVHPDRMSELKKVRSSPLAEPEVDGIPSFIWSPHLIGMG